jgi:acetyl-CoA synthetase
VFASFLNRSTLCLFDGHPSGEKFLRFVQDVKVTMLGVVPSMVKAWRQLENSQLFDWSTIRVLSSTGECSNRSDMVFLMAMAGFAPILEYCGGTEIGGAYITSTLLEDNVPSAFSGPAMGLDFELHDGEVFLKGLSPGLSQSLLNRDHHETYFAGTPLSKEGQALRRHGDEIEMLSSGYAQALGRVDDTMNLGGVKVSSADIERVVRKATGVDDCAAVAMNPKDGGPSSLIMFVVLAEGAPKTLEPKEVQRSMQDLIRDHLNPLFRIAEVRFIEALPRTASNKVMRRELRKLL